MFRNSKAGMVLCWWVMLGAALLSQPAGAANITLGGTIATDDAVQLFDFTVATAGSVDLRSYGYAGGTTSSGTVVPSGGFDSILTLFNASGNFLSENDDGAGVATDPSTGLTGDARITINLAAGSYVLALTQYDNFSRGDLADGFVETGNPNFTADPDFTTGGSCPGNMFRDISGTAGRCRTGNWRVDFVNVANVTPMAPTPEPSALLLAALGLVLLLIRRCRRRGIVALMRVAFVAAVVASVPVEAQTTAGPDYSNVSDYLNGQRTLLKMTDLEVVAINAGDGPNYTQIHTLNSQQTIASSFQWSLRGIGAYNSLQFSARMFNQPSASTITTLHNYDNHLALWIQDIVGQDSASTWTPLAPGDEPLVSCGAVVDLNRNGYEDLVLGFSDGRILVVAPNDPNNASNGFRQSITLLNSLLDITAGDFNGDGRPELAGLTVIPNDQPGGGGLVLAIYTVDPQSLALTPAAGLTLTTPGATPSNPVSRASIIRGRFNGAGHDQLAVAFTTPNGPQSVQVIDFDAGTLRAHEASSLSPGNVTFPYGIIQVKTGKFGLGANPPNPFDQIVYASSSPSANGRFFEVLSVDPAKLTLTANSGITYNDYPYLGKIDVGNFNHRQVDPSNPKQTQPDLNDQIAFLYADTRDGGGTWPYYMNVYSVDPTSLSVQDPPNSNLSIGYSVHDYSIDQINFVATDLQGRSVTLGEPTIIDLSSTDQPSVVVGLPPMHVDFISPNPDGGVPPEILNLSAVPDGFKTTYTNQTTDEHPTSHAETTSWSFGAQEKFSYKDYIGDIDSTGGYFGDTFTAAQNLKHDTDTVHGTFMSQQFDLTNISGSDDVVTHQNQNLRTWVYPVIGQMVHPKDHPDQSVPLTIQFSAPFGDSAREADDGYLLPWYQPPWEPYNILSYPANLEQLENSQQDPFTQKTTLSLLAQGTKFATDSNSTTQKTTWTVSSTEETDIGFNQNYSFENDTSVTAAFGIKGAGDVTASFDLDLSGSYGFNTLDKDSTTLGQSTGLEVTKQTSFPVPTSYRYYVTPYIMGTTKPGGVVDDQKLNTKVQTFGMLRAMFTANPLNSGDTSGGGWWKQAYGQTPDVALNHPARWGSTTLSIPSAGGLPSNCLATGSNNTMDCLELNPRLPDNPGLSAFHQMRGFFISSGLAPGKGPQLETAKAGDVLTLETRVYNYSLTAMPTGTEVHARFYFMPWNVQGAEPAEPNGNSYLIDEVKTGPVPAFNDTSSAPNWELVQTTFDTSKFPNLQRGNVHVLFWVVVWMQDQSGTMIGEIPAHGLMAIPPAGAVDSNGATTIHLPDVAKLECQADGKTCYSNNLGIYPQPFYLAGASLGTAPGSSNASVDIGKVELSTDRVAPGGKVIVSAMLSASNQPASGVTASFYDGNPKVGGRVIGVKRIPHLGQDEPYKIQAMYQTSACGTHEVFVVANQGGSNEVVRRAPPIRVDCSQSMLEFPENSLGQKLK